MTIITALPIELLLVITEFICEEGYFRSAFAAVNRGLSNLLPRKVRKITIRREIERYDQMILRLPEMIDDPYHQLSIINNIETILNIFPRCNGVEGVTVVDEKTMHFLSNIVKNRGFKIKHLRIVGLMNLERFDVTPSLQTLYLGNCNFVSLMKFNLPAFKSLLSLTLFHCECIEDVSCLDSIHDLSLLYCYNVKDISSLNHNYKVSIVGCVRILTYSESFRNSRHVNIVDSRRNMIVLLNNCHILKTLSNNGNSGCELYPRVLQTLSCLSLANVYTIIALPPNRLQKVSIISCRNFNSLDNMNHIRSIHLEDLHKITTLTGLGPKNQIITLKNMNRLEDISALKGSVKVEIVGQVHSLI